MDTDMNKYDLEHVVREHPLMTKEEWQNIYQKAWHIFYSPEHIETLIRRAVVSRLHRKVTQMIGSFYGSIVFEKVHPLQSGVMRRKVRTQRRHGLPRVNPLVFYPYRFWEILRTYIPALYFFLKLAYLRERIKHDPHIGHYSDLSLIPVEDENNEALELFQVTDAAKQALTKAKSRTETMRKIQART
jgi:hypothetical protein